MHMPAEPVVMVVPAPLVVEDATAPVDTDAEPVPVFSNISYPLSAVPAPSADHAIPPNLTIVPGTRTVLKAEEQWRSATKVELEPSDVRQESCGPRRGEAKIGSGQKVRRKRCPQSNICPSPRPPKLLRSRRHRGAYSRADHLVLRRCPCPPVDHLLLRYPSHPREGHGERPRPACPQPLHRQEPDVEDHHAHRDDAPVRHPLVRAHRPALLHLPGLLVWDLLPCVAVSFVVLVLTESVVFITSLPLTFQGIYGESVDAYAASDEADEDGLKADSVLEVREADSDAVLMGASMVAGLGALFRLKRDVDVVDSGVLGVAGKDQDAHFAGALRFDPAAVYFGSGAGARARGGMLPVSSVGAAAADVPIHRNTSPSFLVLVFGQIPGLTRLDVCV
uniref:Uncharacterized protein n=1 Tax=Mycena chlorophos TaxID=658473 RepID=A0ABQ0KZJ0_MYCCL|nr:predicted protein [Mycena chlorophos]